MTWKSLLTIATCAALAVGSTSLIRISLDQTKPTAAQTDRISERCVRLVQKPALWAGVVFFLISNVLWFFIIATQPLVTAYPLQLALVFIFNTLVTASLFAERMTFAGLAGLALILAGVFLVSYSTPVR